MRLGRPVLILKVQPSLTILGNRISSLFLILFCDKEAGGIPFGFFAFDL